MDERKKSYEKIIELNAEINRIKMQMSPLKEKAVIELYQMGYSMDRIASILFIAKVDVLNILHNRGIKIRKKKKSANRKKEKEK